MIHLTCEKFDNQDKHNIIDIIGSYSDTNCHFHKIKRFEDNFAKFCGVDHAVATSSGTIALYAILASLGLKQGDRILTTPFSSVAKAIRWYGAVPTFGLVNEDTYNLDLHLLEEQLRRDKEQINAVIAVHLFGLPCEMDFLQELAAEHGFFIIEDASQAPGASFKGKPVGSWGNAAYFSLHRSMNMTAGQGGFIVTNESEIGDRARGLVGQKGEENYDLSAYNCSMSLISSIIGETQLEKLPEFNESRRENAAYITKKLKGIVSMQIEPPDRQHVYNRYPIQTPKRDELSAYLKDNGITTEKIYFDSICKQSCFRNHRIHLPTAERLSQCVLSLPVHPGLTTEDLDYICNKIRNIV